MWLEEHYLQATQRQGHNSGFARAAREEEDEGGVGRWEALMQHRTGINENETSSMLQGGRTYDGIYIEMDSAQRSLHFV